MPEPSKNDPVSQRPGFFRSVASKFSIFTAILVFWVVATLLAYDLRQDNFDIGKGTLLCVIVLLVAAAISRFTIRLLAGPLRRLHDAIIAVRFDSSEIGQQFTEIVAYGTAVKLEPSDSRAVG